MPSQVLRKLLDGVAQHRAWHYFCVLVEERGEHVHTAPLTDFAEHPARGFMDEVVAMGEESLRNTDCFVILSRADKGPVGDYRHPLVPKSAVHSGKLMKHTPLLFVDRKPLAKYFGGDKVNQIPIVAAVDYGKVEIDNVAHPLFILSLLMPFEDLYQRKETGKPYLMPRRLNETAHVIDRNVFLEFVDDGTCHRHPYPEETVAFAILAGSSFEKPHEMSSLFRIGTSLKPFLDKGKY